MLCFSPASTASVNSCPTRPPLPTSSLPCGQAPLISATRLSARQLLAAIHTQTWSIPANLLTVHTVLASIAQDQFFPRQPTMEIAQSATPYKLIPVLNARRLPQHLLGQHEPLHTDLYNIHHLA